MKCSKLFLFSFFTLSSLHGMDLVTRKNDNVADKQPYPQRRIISRSVIFPVQKESLVENRLSNSCPDFDSLEKNPRSCSRIMWYQKQYNFHYEIAKKYLDAMTLPIYFTIDSAELYKKFGYATKKAGFYYRSLSNQYNIQMPFFDILLERVKLIDKHYLLLTHKQLKEKIEKGNIVNDVDSLCNLLQQVEQVRYKLLKRHHILVRELSIYSNSSNTRSSQLSCFKKFSKTD